MYLLWELFACTFAAFIGSVFVAAIYFLLVHFSRIIMSHTDRRVHLAVALPALADEGLLHLTVGGLGLVGIGTGTKLFNEDPQTLHFIGWLVALGVISFMVARMLCSGPVFRLFAYIGVSARLAIMGVVSFHFAYPSFEPLAIPAALLFTLFLLLSHYIRYYMEQIFGLDPCFGRNRSCPTHREALESVAHIGNQLSVFGLGLLGIGVWGDLAEKSQGLHELLAIYTGCSFWCFCGAKLLGKGLLFELLVFLGTITETGMFVTSGLYLLYPVPGSRLTVFTLSFIVASLGLEWCRIRRLLEKLAGKSEE